MCFPSIQSTFRGVSGGLPRSGVVFVLFFAVGFVALGAEVLWVRYLGLLINNTVYTYTLTLGVVLVGLVLGSVLAAQFSDKTERRAYYFGAFQVATGLVVLALLMLSPEAWRGLGSDLYIYFAVLLPPAVLSGAAFPLAIRLVISQCGIYVRDGWEFDCGEYAWGYSRVSADWFCGDSLFWS